MWKFENYSDTGQCSGVTTLFSSVKSILLGHADHTLHGWIYKEFDGTCWKYYNSKNVLIGRLYQEGKYTPQYVVLQGLKEGNKFFSSYLPGDNPILCLNKVAYRVLGYADTVKEAQMMLFGRNFS